jgi:hypothetical protein
MKTVYISHPLIGDGSKSPAENLAAIGNIARLIAFKEPDTVVLSPAHAFSFLPFDDPKSDQRAREMCRELVALADEVRVFGHWETSEGCKMEIIQARELFKPIIYENDDAEMLKRYYCLAKLDLADPFDDDLTIITIYATSADAARVTFGCSPECEKECGCEGPTWLDVSILEEVD